MACLPLSLLTCALLACLAPSFAARVSLERRALVGHAAVEDDPHFASPDGTMFDFHGINNRAFCFVSDERLEVNTVLRGYLDRRNFGAQQPNAHGMRLRTWMKEVAFLWIDNDERRHSLRLVARWSRDPDRKDGYLMLVQLDGNPVPLPYDGRTIEAANMTFRFTGVTNVTKSGVEEQQETFDLQIADLLHVGIVMRPANARLKTGVDSEIHFNLNFLGLYPTAHVHGVLGQFYRIDVRRLNQSAPFWEQFERTRIPIQADQESGKGYLDGEVQDYVTRSVLLPGCKFSQFGKTADPEAGTVEVQSTVVEASADEDPSVQTGHDIRRETMELPKGSAELPLTKVTGRKLR